MVLFGFPGSRNRPAWPIAPGVPNASVPRKIELTTGNVEDEEAMIKNRMEVAQAAGLRHVEVINGDESFYPQTSKDNGRLQNTVQIPFLEF